MRNRIRRPSEDVKSEQLRTLLDASHTRIARAEAAEPGHTRPQTAIRNGVKTERDTQPVQVRMLKAQIKVLKQIAAQEDRTASDIIRELVDQYIEQCLTTWPEGDALAILQSTIRQTGYWEEFERTPST